MKILLPVIKGVYPELKVSDIINGDSGADMFRKAVQRAKDMGYPVTLEDKDSPVHDLIRPLL